ncbi:hypothetical protein HY227_00895, partial [Candidatus Wolfebacteria bacterium]|nr:hypothetical protein [Candidatus Wolfebacteria bacterium]
MEKSKLQFKIKNFLIIVLTIILFFAAFKARAARLFLETDVKNIGNDRQIESVLKLDPQNQSINAVEGKISFSDNLKLIFVNDGDSIVDLWIQKPILKNNEISFSGIMPGGYNGDLSPFWNGGRPGKILTLFFAADKVGDGEIKLNDSRALLNDGSGTPASLSINNSFFKIA